MKDCCRTGDEQPANPKSSWMKWLLYLAIGLALGFVILEQINF
ncbi:hypothetical protein [Pontibacter burrus]|nr:hypothetical protein [Pontibacter burrus]